jgi:hypothetical protein
MRLLQWVTTGLIGLRRGKRTSSPTSTAISVGHPVASVWCRDREPFTALGGAAPADEHSHNSSGDSLPAPIRRGSRRARLQIRALGLLVLPLYLTLAYGVVPVMWQVFEHYQPVLSSVAARTVTGDGIPGDPLNIAFVGSQADLQQRMLDAGWVPADSITVISSVRTVVDSLAHRPYGTAPVSNLYLQGHKQDLAFEKMMGTDPSRRRHVRFWQSAEPDELGRVVWMGAVTLDVAVGLSHRTGRLTHHIGPDIDQARDQLLTDLQRTSTTVVQWVDAFQTELRSYNGDGDPYVTDGRLAVVLPDSATVPSRALAFGLHQKTHGKAVAPALDPPSELSKRT